MGGSHRLTACVELGLTQTPANVYRNITPDEAIAISYYNNQNQKTFKPETFLDLAHQAHNLKQEGRSLETIGGIFGMSKTNASYHNAIIAYLAEDVLDIVENTFTQFSEKVNDDNEYGVNEQVHRVNDIDWRLKWFRHITPLSHKHQRQIVDKIFGNKGKATTKQIQEWSDMKDAPKMK